MNNRKFAKKDGIKRILVQNFIGNLVIILLKNLEENLTRFFHTLLYKVISKSTVKDFVTKVYVLELPVKFKLKYFVVKVIDSRTRGNLLLISNAFPKSQ